MPATLDIRELPDQLILRVHQSRATAKTTIEFLLGTLAIGLFLYFARGSRPVQILFAAFGIFSLVGETIRRFRGTDVTLEVNNLDLISTGHAPEGYKPSSIPRASIYSLEFHERSGGGGEDAPSPAGLYVEHYGILSNPITCVLPHIDSTQTAQAIAVIMHRFPDTESLAPPRKPQPDTLISLNLNH